VDRKRLVLGGALSNGGSVYAWMKRTLRLPPDEQIEHQLAAMAPGAHGLTMLPLFAGERSTKWRADARAAITGMNLNTGPMEILRAALESVALRFRNIYDIMAEALGRPVITCLEDEASSRGAALLALERLGAIGHVRDLPAATGAAFSPIDANHKIYEDALARQRRLYTKLFEEN
jgi:gluconokinase